MSTTEAVFAGFLLGVVVAGLYYAAAPWIAERVTRATTVEASPDQPSATCTTTPCMHPPWTGPLPVHCMQFTPRCPNYWRDCPDHRSHVKVTP